MKIALYSHDTMGLGHIRRNLLIAQALAESPLKANILIIAGIHEAGAFKIPKGVDCLTLPAYSKDQNGGYAPRSLCVKTNTLISLRSQVIGTALASFEPDLFVVDNVPSGALRELTPIMASLKFSDKIRTVLGYRDILDDPATIRKQWEQEQTELILKELYEAIWIYGDPMVYDPTIEYGFSPDLQAKTRFTGYLDPMPRLEPEEDDANLIASGQIPLDCLHQNFTLCVVGGGQDGLSVAKIFAQCTLPSGECGVIVTGPFLPDDKKKQLLALTEKNPRLHVLEFLPEPMRLMRYAKRVIAMGGYNTVAEILSLGKRALIIPRNRPRLEQTIRAERLQALGLVDCASLEELNTSYLSQWLLNDQAVNSARDLLDFDGLKRIPAIVDAMFQSASSEAVPAC